VIVAAKHLKIMITFCSLLLARGVNFHSEVCFMGHIKLLSETCNDLKFTTYVFQENLADLEI
jgi:hypothetical protein